MKIMDSILTCLSMFPVCSKKYHVEAQPWLMRIGGKGGKKFKASNCYTFKNCPFCLEYSH